MITYIYAIMSDLKC